MELYIFIVLLSEIFQVAAVTKSSNIQQDSGLITARAGDNITLHCSYQDDAVNFLSWYKQHLGDKPDIISTRMKLNKEATISPAYADRFQVEAGGAKGTNHLTIRDIQQSDSAMYYCGILEFNAIEFGEGVFLHVKPLSSNVPAIVQQPTLEPLQVGDSLNLSCTVFAAACAGEQSFYWFRQGAAQSAVMYHKKGQCVSDSESHVKNCTLNLVLKSVSYSDAGMYYCALASCGETVFGNGTSVKIKGGSAKVPLLLVSCLGVALAVSIIVLFILASIMCKLQKKSCSVCKGTVSYPAGSATPDAVSQDAGNLHYAALSLNKTRKQQCQEESVETECVYSRVKSRKE
ncbi:uncharacterized protein LOC117807117 [Xyrichtys novacula]|uniref:Uncharacterized protein LOC117807117 n=1 Tax=Xyrichtys novacula TaxID=13765 RepID=A0AAV1HM66_XYRNO|nr:uncharacterized protein LOC117807117 [Xyrichtys novacula]